jgi:hypothetical protein
MDYEKMSVWAASASKRGPGLNIVKKGLVKN